MNTKINELINKLDYEELKTQSFLGSDIEKACKEENTEGNEKSNYIKDEIIRLYFSEDANNFANPKVYYSILVMEADGEITTVTIERDLDKSPRNYPIKSIKLENMINNDYKSFSGEEIIAAIDEEKELAIDGLAANKPMKIFIDEVINNRKYCPKKDIYYWFKFNSSGRYFLKRDLKKSPR